MTTSRAHRCPSAIMAGLLSIPFVGALFTPLMWGPGCWPLLGLLGALGVAILTTAGAWFIGDSAARATRSPATGSSDADHVISTPRKPTYHVDTTQ